MGKTHLNTTTKTNKEFTEIDRNLVRKPEKEVSEDEALKNKLKKDIEDLNAIYN